MSGLLKSILRKNPLRIAAYMLRNPGYYYIEHLSAYRFDLCYGFDTQGKRQMDEPAIESESLADSNGYEPVSFSFIHKIIKELDVDLDGSYVETPCQDQGV